MKIDTFTNNIIVGDTTKILPKLTEIEKQSEVIIV